MACHDLAQPFIFADCILKKTPPLSTAGFFVNDYAQGRD
jgi:hypothetical protein